MSRLKVDNIETRSGNNVAMDDPLKLKGYTTSQRDALSSPQAGDTVYNSDTGTIDFYNGSSWNASSGTTFNATVEYLVIAGGGGGGTAGGSNDGTGGGGAGGYRNSYASETSGDNGSTETPLTCVPDGTTYTVTVGAGSANQGSDSVFSTITSLGGGYGGAYQRVATSGGSGGGGGLRSNLSGSQPALGTANQGGDGGNAAPGSTNDMDAGGGGGGAGGNGGNAANYQGGNGGPGLASSITGTSVTRGGGGAGGAQSGNGGTGGTGGGGNKESNGTANTGGGGGGRDDSNTGRGNGGSGVVILRYDSSFTCNIGSGLTGSTSTDGGSKVTTFTAGTGTVTFS